MKMKKLPYEAPNYKKNEVCYDIITESGESSTTETENDDWGMGYLPF